MLVWLEVIQLGLQGATNLNFVSDFGSRQEGAGYGAAKLGTRTVAPHHVQLTVRGVSERCRGLEAADRYGALRCCEPLGAPALCEGGSQVLITWLCSSASKLLREGGMKMRSSSCKCTCNFVLQIAHIRKIRELPKTWVHEISGLHLREVPLCLRYDHTCIVDKTAQCCSFCKTTSQLPPMQVWRLARQLF